MAIRIERARLTDLIALAQLGYAGMQESNGVYPDYDAGHLLRGFIGSIERGLAYVAVDAENDQRSIVGALVMDVTEWPQNPAARMLENEHLYVLPEYRSRATDDGVPIGTALMRTMAKLADAAELPAMLRMTFGGDQSEVLARTKLAEREGFALIGTNHWRPPTKKD